MLSPNNRILTSAIFMFRFTEFARNTKHAHDEEFMGSTPALPPNEGVVPRIRFFSNSYFHAKLFDGKPIRLAV